uniref:Uncharacterized protein n=1 Tax=OCS116 cluster bacterium TaxID=2030921 RepID=A0A2A4YQG8_9PROT
MISIFCLMSLLAIAGLSLIYGHIPNFVFMNVGFTILIVPTAACGIALLIQTNVFEKEKSTQVFIMSLPITVKEFTLAKLLVNLPVFGALWIVTAGVAFYFTFGLGLLPLGAVPFITMIFLGIFAAYSCILSISLVSQSLSTTIWGIMFFEAGTSAYLWIVAFLDPIKNTIYGPNTVWNSTAITIVAIQVLVIVFVLVGTIFIQNKKRDFI